MLESNFEKAVLESLAKFDPLVCMACADDDSGPAMPYEFHCVENGEVVLVPDGKLGYESKLDVTQHFYWDVIRYANENFYSELPIQHIWEALNRPAELGCRLFCETWTKPVKITKKRREHLIDTVIQWHFHETGGDPINLLHEGRFPEDIEKISIQESHKYLRSNQITKNFMKDCRKAVRQYISDQVDCLLQAAADECDQYACS